MKILLLVILLMAATGPATAKAQDVLNVDVKSAQIQDPKVLGSLKVEGVGTVNLTATRDGTRIIVQAVKEDGTVVARAESVVGASETPIYVQAPKGLQKLTILWKGP